MGTRRSRHNYGRKPIYKEHRLNHFEASENEIEDTIAQDNSFLFSINAKSLTLETAQSLSEDDAFEAFKAIRWAAHDGRPACVRCACERVYPSRKRKQWTCARCVTQFSATCRTVFASHKMPFSSTLVAIAVTVGASPANNASEAARAIGITSKAAFTFVSRLRAAANLSNLPEAQEKFEIGRPRYMSGLHMSTRCWWSTSEKAALERFVEGGYAPAESANALGRSPTSIAWYARDSGLSLRKDWSRLITPKRAPIERRLDLSYPYIITKRDEHADLLAVNDLVPKNYPPQMRADICQQMMLAVLEGEVTIDEIKANRDRSAWFIKKFWRDNYEQSGHAASLTALEDDDRSYDEVASSISAKDWHYAQVGERNRFADSFSTFQPPTQIDDIWHNQIERTRRSLAAHGETLTFAEVAHIIEHEGYRGIGTEKDHRSHAIVRAEQRYGLRLDNKAMQAIADKIENGEASLIEEENENIIRVVVSYGGRDLPVVYDRTHRFVLTVLPEAR